jgi:hypothetical protein
MQAQKDGFCGVVFFLKAKRRKKVRIMRLIVAILVASILLAFLFYKERDSFLGFQDWKEFGALTPVATGAPGSRQTWDNMLPTTYPLVPGYTGTPKPPQEMLSVLGADKKSRCFCPRAHPFDFRDTERDTVCVKKTAQAFSSACAAHCLGYKDEELYKCKPRWALYRVG